MSGTQSTTARIALLTESDPLVVLDTLPKAVFPIRLRLRLNSGAEHDSRDQMYQEPDYPVTLRHPDTPYIPETTVRFDNPALRPIQGTKAWGKTDCIEKMADLIAHLDGVPGVDPEDLSLTELDVVEVPGHLLTTDTETGDVGVKPELYNRREEMVLARFQKDGRVSASQVRDRLEDALPGEERTPIRLVEIQEVTGKPTRLGENTQNRAGRAQYFTEHDAEKVNDLSLTPAVYRLRHLSRPGDRSRPLSPVIGNINEFLPTLSREAPDLVETMTFAGDELEQTVFHAREVYR